MKNLSVTNNLSTKPQDSSKAILQLTKVKSLTQLNNIAKYLTREYTPANADPSRQKNNRNLLEFTTNDYRKLWAERVNRIKKSGGDIRLRRDSVIALHLITTFSHGADIDIEQWIQDNQAWIQSTFGENNIIAMVLHMDEATPHIHALIIPIDENNHLNAKGIIGGPAGLRALHTSYANAMAKHGLVRGDSKCKAHYHHIQQFYRDINEAVNIDACDASEEDTVETYKRKAKEQLEQVRLSALRKEYEYKEKIAELNRQLAKLTNSDNSDSDIRN